MAIINNTQSITYTPQSLRRSVELPGAQNQAPGIGEQISSAVKKVNELQQNADGMIEQVASGNVENAHQAVVAMEQALMSLDFTLQVRNKVLDAYQEIMRTQM